MECRGILIAALISRENPPARGGWSPWGNLFMSSFQELCECKSHFSLGWKIILWRDVLHCGKGDFSWFAWEWFPSFLISAHEAFESCCHHLTARADQSADWDNILQSAWALWDPQGILWWALSPGAAVESPATCWGPLPKAGESAAITRGAAAPHPPHRSCSSLWWLQRPQGSKSVAGIDERFLTSSLGHCTGGPTAKKWLFHCL